jgi:opacity protein-like surface antigen
LGLLFSISSFASVENDWWSGSQFVIGVTPAVTWASSNRSQTLALQPDVENTYTADNNTSAFPSGEIFIGLSKAFAAYQQPLLGQLGISVVYAGSAKLSGDILDDSNANFDNSNFNYKVTHTHVALQGRLISNANWLLEPYISGGVGASFNRSYAFSIQPTNPSEVAAPPFNSNSTTSFVYTLGIGLQKSLTTNLQVALGYEFADWGKTQLARADGQTLNQGLTLNNLYVNQLQLSLFYIF